MAKLVSVLSIAWKPWVCLIPSRQNGGKIADNDFISEFGIMFIWVCFIGVDWLEVVIGLNNSLAP